MLIAELKEQTYEEILAANGFEKKSVEGETRWVKDDRYFVANGDMLEYRKETGELIWSARIKGMLFKTKLKNKVSQHNARKRANDLRGVVGKKPIPENN